MCCWYFLWISYSVFWFSVRSVVYQQNSKESATLQPFFTLQLDIQSEKIRTVQEALETLVARESVQGYTSKTKQEVWKKTLLGYVCYRQAHHHQHSWSPINIYVKPCPTDIYYCILLCFGSCENVYCAEIRYLLFDLLWIFLSKDFVSLGRHKYSTVSEH